MKEQQMEKMRVLTERREEILAEMEALPYDGTPVLSGWEDNEYEMLLKKRVNGKLTTFDLGLYDNTVWKEMQFSRKRRAELRKELSGVMKELRRVRRAHMSGLLMAMQQRRSIRKYTDEKIPEEKMNKILQAAILAPSSRAFYAWKAIVVEDRETLKKLVACKDIGAEMLEGAAAAIVVLGDREKSDVWVEDASIVMTYMHLMATDQNLGSCWIQCRLRKKTEDGEERSCDDVLREILGYDDRFEAEAILSLGFMAEFPRNKALPVVADSENVEFFK